MEIGSIVECINDKWDFHVSKIKMPIKGKLYTVTGFCNKWPKGEGIYIAECDQMIGVKDGRTGKTLGRFKSPFLKSRFAERVSVEEVKIEELIQQQVESH